MSYSTCLHAVVTSYFVNSMNQDFRALIEPNLQQIVTCVLQFATTPINPASTETFEKNLASATREMSRRIVGATYNQIETAAVEEAPKFIDYEATDYRRLNQATPNRHVSTLFGTITLWRHGYRPRDRDSSEAMIFPLEQTLGLMEGTTPALAERVGFYLAEAGATQSRVLEIPAR